MAGRRPIDGFPGYFVEAGTDACPRGKIISTHGIKEIELTLWLNHGYYHVTLCKDGHRVHKKVHRLIALTFIPLVDGCDYVDHIWGDQIDNRLIYLRWVNKSDNGLNSGIRISNTSGFMGVVFRNDGRPKSWMAQILVNGKHISKCFSTKIEAMFQRVAWEIFYEIPNHQRVKLKITRL